MNPDCTPQQIKSRLGISWRDYRHLQKTCPQGNQDFNTWSKHGFSGELIRNMRARKPTKSFVLDTPQQQNEPISIYDAVRRLGRKSPYYSNALLGCDEQGRFAIIGTDGLYVPLGNWHEAHRWLLAKCAERKAA